MTRLLPMTSTLVAVLIIFHNIPIISALVSCEGFIKSNIQIDYSKIQAKLFTTQGNLKHETECNPQNGYFFIPIYNKGKYLIKVSAPEGWVFVPDLHEIEIATDDDECPGELNFELFGLQIKGAVLNSQHTSIALGLYQENGNLIEKTKTDENGQYKFIAKPGKYVISPISNSELCVDRGSINVEVVNSPVNVKPDIRIAGHNLKVQVNDENGNPLANARAILASERQIKFENLPINAEQPLATSQDGQWFYSLKTAASGYALFHCLQLGKYTLNAKLEKSNMEVHFEKKQIEMDSKAKQVSISINAFTLFGRMIVGRSKPIGEVDILIDGNNNGMRTDKDGKFKLTGIRPGKYRIVADKEHYQFAERQIEAASGVDSEIILTPKKMAICGSMIWADKLNSPPMLAVKINNNDGGAIVDKFQANEDGKFCKMFEPGKYILQPISNSISFSPKQFEIDLSEGPVLGLKFIQYKAKVGGKIDCLFGNCKKIQLELWEDGGLLVAKLDVPSNGAFGFNDILPAKYRLKIVDEESIWWEEGAEKAIEVLDKDLVDIKFVQKGYRLQIRSTHPAKLKYWPKSAKSAQKEVALTEGINYINFTEANKFEFSLESCYEFRVEGADDGNAFGVPSATPIVLTATSYSISVVVLMEADDASLQLILREKSLAEELAPHQIMPLENGRQTFVFRLDNEKIGKEFKVIPKSERLLFPADSVSFIFDGKCNSELAVLKTQIGKFIQGSVNPVVAEADVMATHRTQPDIVLTAKTDKSGKFRIGPVWDVRDFTVAISKEGFEFRPKPSDPFLFESVKLSQLIIQFLDSQSKAPLSDVLVSISGETSFRSKNITDSSGILNFIGLAPASYYIRPILQEYKFNSSSFTVQITEGQTEELLLEAKRYAYSVFGKVSTIGSRPFRIPIRIEAISAECENHHEEALLNPKTDEYRIRGLKPECIYKITLNDADKDREIKAFPTLMNIKTGTNDKTGVNFVLLPTDRPDPVAVGELVLPSGSNLLSGGFRVQLLEGGNVLQEQLVHGPTSIFFFNLPAYNRKYTIKADRIEAKQLKLRPVSVHFVADSTLNYARLEPEAEQRSSDIEVLKANYLGLALILLITLVFLNQSKAKLVADYLLNTARQFINRRQGNIGGGNAQIEDAMKKRKARKML